MNEQLQKALSDLLNMATSGVEEGTKFLMAEIPDVLQQLLMWYGVKSAVETVLALLSIVVLVFLNKKSWKWYSAYKLSDEYKGMYSSDREFVSAAYWVCTAIVNTLWILVAWCYFSLEWLQIWIAPKVWLIEYATTLSKGA